MTPKREPKRAREPRRERNGGRRPAASATPGRASTARHAAWQALIAVESGARPRLRDALQVEGLSPADRGLAFELCQGTERNHLLLDFVLARLVTRKLPGEPELRSALRLGAYQLLFSSRIPQHAVVHETVALLQPDPETRTPHGAFVNAVLRRLATTVLGRAAEPTTPRREIPLPEGPGGARALVFDGDVLPTAGTAEFLAVRYGLPDFLTRRWVDAFGFADAEMCAVAASLPPEVVLRRTWLAPSTAELQDALRRAGVTARAIDDDLLVVEDGQPFATEPFRAGWCIAQDPTAVAAARAVEAQSGDTVLDLCAAPGTKTMLLAEAVGDAGRVLAHDRDPSRAERIGENARRLQLTARVAVIPADALPPGPESPLVDRVLVDVPCSNTGVLARRVEVRRRLDGAAFATLAAAQTELLSRGLAACRPGGTVVYSTCSIEPEENRQVVDAALAQGPGRELLREQLTLPEPFGCDGGYFAVLRVG